MTHVNDLHDKLPEAISAAIHHAASLGAKVFWAKPIPSGTLKEMTDQFGENVANAVKVVGVDIRESFSGLVIVVGAFAIIADVPDGAKVGLTMAGFEEKRDGVWMWIG